MATTRLTRGQRKAQAHQANLNLKREAERIAYERNISFDEAFTAVLKDPELSAKCHAVAPIENLPPNWPQ